ncbi:NnrU family protein [Glycocaulis sp.]|uniref:NnrU family protein n=1 Tax=Glycocaulis sp. TaxID=1969725 RepID=UPI003D24035B
MEFLIVGLALFLGVHSVRLVGLRGPMIAVLGQGAYSIVYSLVSAIGLALIVYGHILAHPSAAVWAPPEWTRTLALVVVPLSIVLIVSAYVPGHIRSTVRHPMTLGVLLWAAAHLVANGEIASVILFGSFAAWALLTLIGAYVRGGSFASDGKWSADIVAIIIGLVAAGLLAWFHMELFGVAVVEFASDPYAPGI